jgi:hypothetical protein
VKFARHLAMTLFVVAVIVAPGMTWAHANPAGGYYASGRGIPDGPGRAGLNLSNSQDLIRTVIIETCVAATVVTVSAIRLRRRRASRASRAQV